MPEWSLIAAGGCLAFGFVRVMTRDLPLFGVVEIVIGLMVIHQYYAN